MGKKTLSMILLSLVIVVGYCLLFPPTQEEQAELLFMNHRITVSGSAEAAFSLPMEDVVSCTLRSDWDVGEAVRGGKTSKVCYGVWRNAEVGEYRIFTRPKLTEWVVIVSDAGDTYVINSESNATTVEIHAALHRSFRELGLSVAGAPES